MSCSELRDGALDLSGGRGLFAFGHAGNGARLRAQRHRLLGRHGRRRWWRRWRLLGKRLAVDQQTHLVGIEDFAFEQSVGNALESVAMGFENVASPGVSAGDDAADFSVDFDSGVFGIIAMLGDFAAEEDRFFFFAERERAESAD